MQVSSFIFSTAENNLNNTFPLSLSSLQIVPRLHYLWTASAQSELDYSELTENNHLHSFPKDNFYGSPKEMQPELQLKLD